MNVIQIENLWKEYRLGVINQGYLIRDLQSWWARKRGKDDPNSKFSSLHVSQESQVEGDRFWALRDINLEVKQGEVLGIIGRNGAGKSTLLKILSRVTAPTRGHVKIKGRIASLLEVGTGFHEELTGRENIFMNGSILGMSKPEIKNKLDEIIEFSGVEAFVDTPVKRYSSGMRVRLAFAVAAHLEPEILLVDEVLAVGDAGFQKKCLGKMGDVSKEGRTVLFVSHNMAAISTLCPDSLLLNSGQMIQSGKSPDIIEKYYKTVAGGGEPRMSQHPGADIAEFISGRILNHNNEPCNSVKITDPFIVEMVYRIRKQTDGVVVPNFHFCTSMGAYCFVSSAPGLKTTEPGIYKAICMVPGKLMNEGTFSIGLAATTFLTKGYKVNFFETNLLTISIVDPKIPNESNYGYVHTVPGVIRPELNWEVEEHSL